VSPVVVKIGGGLMAVPGAVAAVGATVAAMARRDRVVVVPGGGPFADLVREVDRRDGLPASTAHWMAILAMDQYAHLLTERIEGATLVEDTGGIGVALAAGRVAVLAPSRWIRAADVLPRSWDVTSDSIAAFVAGALDASRLILVKPGEPGDDGVDPCFTIVAPVNLEVSVVAWDRFAGRSAGPE
jgi:5-(aminomethyl)-3-furanmethanol phosphate kinase